MVYPSNFFSFLSGVLGINPSFSLTEFLKCDPIFPPVPIKILPPCSPRPFLPISRALRALKPPRHHRHLSAAVANSSRVAPPLWTTPTCAAISSGSASTWATSATGSFAPNPAGSPSSPCTRGSRPQSRLQPHLTSALAASALRRHHHRLRRRVAKPGHHSVSPIHHRNTISSTQSGRRLSPSPATSNLVVAAVRSAASGRTSADPPSSPKVAGAPLPPLKVSSVSSADLRPPFDVVSCRFPTP